MSAIEAGGGGESSEEEEGEGDEENIMEYPLHIQVGVNFSSRSCTSEVLMAQKTDGLNDPSYDDDLTLKLGCSANAIKNELELNFYPNGIRWGAKKFGEMLPDSKYTLMLGGVRGAPRMVALDESRGRNGRRRSGGLHSSKPIRTMSLPLRS